MAQPRATPAQEVSLLQPVSPGQARWQHLPRAAPTLEVSLQQPVSPGWVPCRRLPAYLWAESAQEVALLQPASLENRLAQACEQPPFQKQLLHPWGHPPAPSQEVALLRTAPRQKEPAQVETGRVYPLECG